MQPRTVVVIGQGYVGLPVAMRAVEVGFRVIGLEVDPHRASELIEGRSYVEDISDARLGDALRSGRYLPTSDYAETAGFDVAVITVPTPLREGHPDLSYIESAAASLSETLTPGCCVILESTTYPGTTEELLVPALELGSGLVAGRDFHVGYSPERIDPGNATWGFVQTPKVVSGINPSSLQAVQSFYDELVDTTVAVSTPKEAELSKLLENTFRHVNIALVNELAVFANQLGVDVWEAIEAASTKPFGFMKFTPGPGVGGHCLPVDPSYLSWQVRRRLGHNFRFVELANDINDHMPDYVIQRLLLMLNSEQRALSGSTVLVVGLAYKKNTSDIREAPSMRLIELLLGYGARVIAVDGHVDDKAWPAEVERVELSSESLKRSDIAVLITDHDGLDLQVLAEGSVQVLDTRNVISGSRVSTL